MKRAEDDVQRMLTLKTRKHTRRAVQRAAPDYRTCVHTRHSERARPVVRAQDVCTSKQQKLRPLINRVFINSEDAAVAPHALALGLLDTERMTASDPGQRFFENALRQMPDGAI